jgi:hypothetical protein
VSHLEAGETAQKHEFLDPEKNDTVQVSAPARGKRPGHGRVERDVILTCRRGSYGPFNASKEAIVYRLPRTVGHRDFDPVASSEPEDFYKISS